LARGLAPVARRLGLAPPLGLAPVASLGLGLASPRLSVLWVLSARAPLLGRAVGRLALRVVIRPNP
jgi:hypothetical protein